MLRALGLKKNHLVSLLFIEAFIFALPGLGLGLLLSYLLNSIAGMVLFDWAQMITTYELN